MNGPLEVWHFCAEKDALRDGSPFELGKPLPPIAGEVKACSNGYHGSPSVLDALAYAYGPHLYRRTLSGVIVPQGEPIDKYAASEAVATAYCDATPLLRIFARQCALDVIHRWKAPQVVKDYLLTGAARAAAWAAARDAAWAAARGAARGAARDAARGAQRALLDAWCLAYITDGTLPEVKIPEAMK